MTPENVKQGLQVIQDRFHSILDSSASHVLSDARQQLAKYKLKKGKPVEWSLDIPPVRPLRFRKSVLDHLNIQVDLSCALRWRDGLTAQNVLLRIWSFDSDVCYRDAVDSDLIRERLPSPPSRVIARFHFDKANAKQEGPTFHLQYGGKAEDDELFWHPEAFAWPRFLHHPIDLVLACELVAANFYIDDYRRISKEPTWVGVMRCAQQSLLDDYYTKCRRALSAKTSLTDDLWNRN